MRILEEMSPIAQGSPPLRSTDASETCSRFQFSKVEGAGEGRLQSRLPRPKRAQSKHHFKVPLKRNTLGIKQSFQMAALKS